MAQIIKFLLYPLRLVYDIVNRILLIPLEEGFRIDRYSRLFSLEIKEYYKDQFVEVRLDKCKDFDDLVHKIQYAFESQTGKNFLCILKTRLSDSMNSISYYESLPYALGLVSTVIGLTAIALSSNGNNTYDGLNFFSDFYKPFIATIAIVYILDCLKKHYHNTKKSFFKLCLGIINDIETTNKLLVQIKEIYITNSINNSIKELVESNRLLIVMLNNTIESTNQYANAEENVLAIKQLETCINETASSIGLLLSYYESMQQNSTIIINEINDEKRILQKLYDEIVARNKSKTPDIKNITLALAEKSKEIGSALTLINDVSSQTKILSINASIEAARSGDSGKGFAVVADSIQNLSKQSYDAAKKVEFLLEDIKNKINQLME